MEAMTIIDSTKIIENQHYEIFNQTVNYSLTYSECEFHKFI